jgi:alginate O-acetyltransferase complex protein AlgI
MIFNSIAFFIFLPIVFFLYWKICHRSLTIQNILLLLASYYFYGWWSLPFLSLLILSTLLDYSYGFGVASSDKKKAKIFLWLSIINNLGILAVFKYYDFFASQLQIALASVGANFNPILLDIILPVGISFYTFHGMSYIFDVYKGRQAPVSNFVDYAVFVGFFPLLMAGPIERAHHLLPQIQRKRIYNSLQLSEGCRLIIWGLFKKIVIADSLAISVNVIFQNYQQFNAITLIVGAVAFSFQIYCDFSGYCDIALGTAKLFGFELLSNFKFPYFSRNIAEFWKRWHISLSSWFRDYVYIPLGGSREGKAKAIRNIFVVFLLSALWHGAKWHFVVWGFIHALLYIPIFLGNKKLLTNVVAENSYLPSISEFFQITFTFTIVTIAWIFFRAENVHSAFNYIHRIAIHAIDFPSHLSNIQKGANTFIYIIPLIIGDWILRKNERKLVVTENRMVHNLILIFLLVFILVYSENQTAEFIYFQF